MAFTPLRLAAALEACLAALDPRPGGLCVALSGGLDSTVLLAALAQGRAGGEGGVLPLRAVHVDHGLQADSSRWGDHCARQAAALGVPLTRVRVDATPGPGASPEAAARKARYAALAAYLEPGEVLLTAHHADDQLETVLLQWLRGGGLRAVAGMPAMAAFARGWHARPLLGWTREELRAWAIAQGLDWAEDPSNLDTRFDRNFLRLEVLPVVRRRWPAAARTAARVALRASEALQVESETAAADLAVVGEGATLSLARLQALPAARQRWVLRAWLRALGRPVPPAGTLAALMRDMGTSAADRLPRVEWAGARVHRYRGRLYAVATTPGVDLTPAGDWVPGTSFDLGAFGRLESRPSIGVGLSRARLPAVLRVTARAAGESFVPAGAAQHRPLRKWLQERGVLPWLRSRIPLVMAGDEIAAIGDLAYGAAYLASADEPSWALEWVDRPPLTEREFLEVKSGA